MAKQNKTKSELRGKARVRSEIVEMAQSLHRIGAMSNGELEKTTIKMLGRMRCRRLRRYRRPRSPANSKKQSPSKAPQGA
jgi:hypothetical protein